MIIVKQEGKESGDLIIGKDVETIQRALNKAKVENKDVLVYPGTYVGSRTLTIPRGVNLTGKGMNTTLNFPTMSGDVIKFSGTEDVGTKVSNLRVVSYNPTEVKVEVDKVMIEEVYFNVVGIVFDNSSNSKISKCRLDHSENPQTILVNGGKNVAIDLCSILDNVRGITVKSAENVSITNTRVSETMAIGIKLEGAKTVVITSSIVDGSGSGIDIDSTSLNISIAGNVIKSLHNQGTSVLTKPNATVK